MVTNIAQRYIDITINLNTSTITRKTFSQPLIIGEANTVSANERMRTFESLKEVTDAGFATTSFVYAAARDYYAQQGFNKTIYVGLKADAETYAEAINEIRDANDSFYCIIAETIDAIEQQAIATYLQSADRNIIAFLRGDDADILAEGTTTDTASVIKATDNDLVHYVYHNDIWKTGNDDGFVPEAAMSARVLPIPETADTAPGSIGWDKQPIKGIAAPSLKASDLRGLNAKNVSYLQTDGQNITVHGGKMLGNEWGDVIHGTHWLEVRLEEDLYDLLRRNAALYQKVSFTDQGMAQIRGAMVTRLDQAVATGLLLDYSIETPTRSAISADDLQARKLQGLNFTASLAGAINSAVIVGNIGFEGV